MSIFKEIKLLFKKEICQFSAAIKVDEFFLDLFMAS